MKKLDVYILRKFIGTFIYAISLISIIIIVFDISEKLDDFLSKHAPLKGIVFDYYFNFVPYLVNLFSPLFTFIAVVFFTSRLAARSEIIAILSSGISFRRLMYPYIVGAFLIASLSFYFNHIVIPNANKTRLRFEDIYLKNPYYTSSNRNVHKQISPGTFIYMDHFDNADDKGRAINTGYKFALEKIQGQKLKYKLMAESVTWDSAKKEWNVFNYFTRKFLPDGRQVITEGLHKDTALGFLPSDFVERLDNVEAMNYTELNQYIAQKQMEGSSNIMYYEVEKDRRTAFPFATFILTFIGVALSSRKKRGGTGLDLGIGLLIAFSFILFMQVSTTFAEGGLMPPLLAVWIPNILYGILAFFMLKAAPK